MVVVVVSLCLLSFVVEVENDSSPGSSSGSKLSHLLLKVQSVLWWEILKDLGQRGHLSNENKHVLTHVLGKGSHRAGLWILGAESEQVEGTLLEVADRKVLHNLGHRSEHVHVLLDISDVSSGTGNGDSNWWGVTWISRGESSGSLNDILFISKNSWKHFMWF